MSNNLNSSLILTGSVGVSNPNIGPFLQSAGVQLGQPGQIPRPTWPLSSGGTDGSDAVYVGQFTIAASGTQNLDFYSGLTDILNASLVWSKLFFLMCSIVDAAFANTNVMRVGPLGVSNPIDLLLGGTGSSNYQSSAGTLIFSNGPVGFTVSSSANTVQIKNTGSSAITVNVLAIGKV